MSTNMFVSGFSPPYMLHVTTKTWLRDSHDLFDYETNHLVCVSHFAASCGLKLLREESDVRAIEYNNVVDKEHDHLLSVVCKRTGEYVVMPAEKVPGSLLYPQKLWLIVRTLPYQRYALQENDVIKLGRFRLRVKQLVPGPLETPNSTSALGTCSHGAGRCPGSNAPECPYYGDAAAHNSNCKAKCTTCRGQEGAASQSAARNPRDGADEQLVKLFDGVIPEKTITFEEQCNMQCRICLAEGYLHNPLSSSDNTNTPLHSSKETSLDAASDKDLSGHFAGNADFSNTNAAMTPENGLGALTPSAASFEADRLICACECKGSIKYVHVECLRKWIDSRWNLKGDEPMPSMVFIREVSCELCKTNYPCYIRQNGELIQIVKMPKMPVPFLVLENITPHAIKGVHLLSMKDMKDLKLGRGHESDVRIPDVSISRYHATIRYENGQFYLEDHDSKFGTLVSMRRPRMVSHKEPLSVQVGRSVINLAIDESLPYVQNRVMTLTTARGGPGGNGNPSPSANGGGSGNGPANVSSNGNVGAQQNIYRNVEPGSNVGLTSSSVHGPFAGGMTLTSTGEVGNNFMGLNARLGAGAFATNAATFMASANNFCAANTAAANSGAGSGPVANPSAYVGAPSNSFTAGASYMSADANGVNPALLLPPWATIEYENALNSSRYLSFLQTAYSTVINSNPATPINTTPSSAMNISPGNAANANAASGNTPTGAGAGAGAASQGVMGRGSNLAAAPANSPALNLASPLGVASSGLGAAGPEAPGNLIATNTGRNNLVATISASPRTPTNAVPGMGSAASSASGITNTYWSLVRSAIRSSYDPDILDGLGNHRLDSFRLHRSAFRAGGAAAAQSAASPNAPASGAPGSRPVPSGEEVDMMLPDSVFIANWNAARPANVDLNVDTSTSALEQRHSGQELDKPATRL
ncbi:uncharacterized protein TOT_010000420 [Theileria orientalis strain Shintoku]|uniref:FHA domain protein n=1 Tax=Theileria orientalis strain Shintoku TaxID=869250 RepID=J4D5G9_THEOR|nr:uncharacterized protein TOT_010000420 [Theileria orientalis strain Shintoku]BAM38955.1 uncharacterized protein TOT_010000420 [Theileria orientalis strain Shintoku]|eukprot:XP_009689256.1 uncharacterized protein TOT_010000420 [Theileria orientalis strain Shintoku]